MQTGLSVKIPIENNAKDLNLWAREIKMKTEIEIEKPGKWHLTCTQVWSLEP